MSKQPRERLTLQDGSRIVVLGGGPAGAFFAIHLLRQAKKVHQNISVTIIDKRMALEPSRHIHEFKGCNFCAGIISPRLQKELVRSSIQLPSEVICEKFTHIWIHGLWKNFPFKVPAGQSIFSVFRGTLPSKREGGTQGLDAFFLKKAVEQGADIINGEAQTIQYSPGNKPSVMIKPPLEDVFTIESDFICICTGINSNPGKEFKEDRFWRSYQGINPLFTPPKLRPTLIFELKPGSRYLKKYMYKELYIIVSRAKKINLEHIALIPKGEYLTVALVGKSIDRASFPEDTAQIIQTVMSLSRIQNILPHITPENTPIACTCYPYMAVAPCNGSFSDRIAMAGDALGARLYRDGLFSAFISARALAQTVIHKGVDKKSLSDGYGWVRRWLKTDNQYGKFVINVLQAVLKFPLLNRILYQTFATEMKFKQRDKWPLGGVLWKVGSGDADYKDVFKALIRGPVFLSILTGVFKTFRNIFTEIFFGLNWEVYGRYPTVIIKEKRDYIKESIAKPLGIKLDASPEMERMYAIKIRASSGRIFKELGKFGDPVSKFLRIRFVDVKRTFGLSNKEGAVVSYSMGMLPVLMNVCLVKSLPGKALLYEPAGFFTEQGKLLFDITPTRDGNNRLVLYTAFDFKKGKSPLGRIFWNLFKQVFPDYAHDVVWNHAICCIKGEAEKNAGLMTGP
ncbi:MAG: hypothetical protein K8S13_15960 [Desulfobacula sp.]|uniref:NAD(P)/FAD-dependent oxidoreductase n=1 Tax=Desulfobacula sp. TaxID=2593537 RepID=UPI0025C5CCF6|nr:hypothetical protein [Desulfobacula sp.]MCD4721335.1 hypothetical protein [Desulfobacula sp.]